MYRIYKITEDLDRSWLGLMLCENDIGISFLSKSTLLGNEAIDIVEKNIRIFNHYNSIENKLGVKFNITVIFENSDLQETKNYFNILNVIESL